MDEKKNAVPSAETEAQMHLNLTEQAQIRREKLSAMQAAGSDPYAVTKAEVDTHFAQIRADFDAYEGKTVKVAGRMMSRRDMGKANFFDLLDATDKMQCYIRTDDVGQAQFDAFSKWDLGDIVAVEGKVFRTRRGEISIHTEKISLLSKALMPLPEKFHGLRDTDLRYRQRYLDLIVNPETRKTFLTRSAILREIRNLLDERGFLEVETSVLHNIAGGAAARPFITHHNTLDMDMVLRIALELHLKRLIVGGFERVYEIGRVFRNEGMDTRHNPEFTMLECYQAYTDYAGMMELTEYLFRECARRVLGTCEMERGGVTIDFEKPFERLSMCEAVKRYAKVDFSEIQDIAAARKLADERHIAYEKRHGVGDILNLFFDEYVEENLRQPTFITEYPVEISPLAKRCVQKPRFTERFELFILGAEYANAFSELNDPIDQRARFEAQAAAKAAGDEEACDIDEDFLCALEYGMPPTGGLGIGIDRMVMLLCDAASVRDVLLFPTMKPIE